MANTQVPIESTGPLLRPADPTKLPADKIGRWMFTGARWSNLNDDQRKRWREWFDWAVRPGGELWDERSGRAVLRGARLDEADISWVHLARADLTGASVRSADLGGAELRGAILARAHLENTGLQRASLVEADLSYAHIAGVDLTGADLSGAMLHDMDLTRVDFKDARLFSTKITDPVWWVEMPHASLAGRTIFPGGLPEHPIQDVQGLPPVLRRQLADAQYLLDLHRKLGPGGRWLMWLWGVTCCYGQSFLRWGLCTVALLVFFSAAYMFFEFNFSAWQIRDGVAISSVHKPDFWHGMYFSISTMMTLGLGDVIPATGWGRVVVSAQEVLGYIMLGGLLSIFSNKLARLS